MHHTEHSIGKYLDIFRIAFRCGETHRGQGVATQVEIDREAFAHIETYLTESMRKVELTELPAPPPLRLLEAEHIARIES